MIDILHKRVQRIQIIQVGAPPLMPSNFSVQHYAEHT